MICTSCRSLRGVCQRECRTLAFHSLFGWSARHLQHEFQEGVRFARGERVRDLESESE